MLNKGFVTALGTPLDREGNFLPDSMAAHVESQIAAGAAALLCMGSMGQQPYIPDSQTLAVARTCADTVRGRLPLFIGVSDVSVRRVRERIEALKGLAIDGVVATAPFYYAASQAEIVSFYQAVADRSPWPLYLYDLPPVSQAPFSAETVLTLSRHPNIAGIKSANLTMLRRLQRNPGFDPRFLFFYSGLDTMDAAFGFGLPYMLDGMFSCTPVNSAAFGRCLAAGDTAGAGIPLDRILDLRDAMARFGIWTSFTYVMNRLGFPGLFHPDYIPPRDEGRELLDKLLRAMGEIA